MKTVHTLLMGVAGAIVLGCSTVDSSVQQGPGYLTHEELKALLSAGKTVNAVAGSTKAVGVYAPDGTARLDWGTGTARGTWRITGNTFCTKYREIRRGYESCYLLRKTERGYTLLEEATGMTGTWVVEK